MVRFRRCLAVLPIAVAYFVAVSISMLFDPYAGGITFLWAGTAIIIADLSGRRYRAWLWRLPGFLVASFLASSLFGKGWPAALPIGLNDLAEAAIATHLLSRAKNSQAPLGSLAWITGFVVPVGIVAPVMVGTYMAAISLMTGFPPLSELPRLVAGHALGNILFTPLVMLVHRGGLKSFGDQVRRGRAGETAILLGLVGFVATGVFMQDTLPLLFLPILPLILVSFRLGHGASGVAAAIVGVIGTAFTLNGMGPIQLIQFPLGDQLLFLQFFFAMTVLTALPVAADLELRSQLHRDMRLSEARYRLLAEHSTDIMMHLDTRGTILYVSPSIWQVAGFDPAELTGTVGRCMVDPDDLPRVIDHHRAILSSPGRTHAFEYRARTANGSQRWFEAHGRALCDPGGQVEGVLTIVRDVSARKKVEEQLAEDALTDSLTSLCNRRAFERIVRAHVDSRDERQVDCIAVFDVDHFKQVNDRFGHDAGDAVLRTFARVMRGVMRDTDAVARIGGEEFAVLLTHTSVEQALTICDRLRVEMSQMETLCNGARIRVTLSGGVAVLGDGGLERALRDADQALYRAKRGGRDRMALAA